MSVAPNPHAVIEVGGQRFDSWKDQSLFAGVEIDLTTEEASQVVWQVFDLDFKFLDKWTTSTGLDLLPASVWLGFGDDLGQPVFGGLLAKADHSGGITSLKFHDKSLRMRLTKKTEYHKGLDDIDIIRKLAERNGLKFEGPIPPISPPLDKHKSLIQDAQNDLEFAHERADEIGVVLFVRGDTLYAKEAAKSGTPVLTLAYRKGGTLLSDFNLSFKVPENRESRPRTVETRTRGHAGKRLRGAAQESDRGTDHVEIKRDLAIKTKRHADRRAEAKKALEREHAFDVTVSFLPSFSETRPDVRQTVALQGMGKLFSGNYIINSVTHSLRAGELKTTLQLYSDVNG